MACQALLVVLGYMRSKFSDLKELGTSTSLQLNNAVQASSTHRGEDHMAAAEQRPYLKRRPGSDPGVLICVCVSISAACHSSDSGTSGK